MYRTGAGTARDAPQRHFALGCASTKADRRTRLFRGTATRRSPRLRDEPDALRTAPTVRASFPLVARCLRRIRRTASVPRDLVRTPGGGD